MTDRPHRSRGSQHDKWLRDAPSALARAFAPVAGYGVTISSMFRPVVTEQYPFEPPQVMPRYHAATSSTATTTAWRSASAASCAPGPAPPMHFSRPSS